ncbi:hypothetical protein [Puniceicoccus vermicola]|uniref:Uncharacterized protein n=1 Tax=Puniceicoccus vermicola TaxID=388746 RepID=A0A7X1E4H4_9BACT|nr:hypothetical protein [Puniceicoccus vermicola]MBC2600622.1 hypothetical protein [Puniceicoccus vermicola]
MSDDLKPRPQFVQRPLQRFYTRKSIRPQSDPDQEHLRFRRNLPEPLLNEDSALAKRLTISETRGLDQLELYRKACLPHFLNELEKSVFRHEAVLIANPELRENEDRPSTLPTARSTSNFRAIRESEPPGPSE